MRWRFSIVFGAAVVFSAPAAEPDMKLLFLGDNGHHNPADRFRQLQPVLAKRNIDVAYTDKVDALRPNILSKYDGLILYANIDNISPEAEKALLDFVAAGKGFVPLHCASYCFRNSPRFIELVGAQFLRHGAGVFRTAIAATDHPVMKGFHGFESWDETYVHAKHNDKDRIILEHRVDGNQKEPWTWVRTHGKGRVFYTAWGHDERTWSHPGFLNLVERGIRWACGKDPSVVAPFADRPTMTALRNDVKPFEYVNAKVPFYPAGQRWGVTGQPIAKMQKPLPADESIKHFVTPVGFEVKLFVDETKLGGKPICMAWDERGRLWAALTLDYPNERQDEGKGRDRIVICEDTDHDGVCDKVSTFADKLSVPTSLAFAYGGVVVLQAPHTLFLKDTDGDGVADLRQVLFTGWGVGDTHAGPSNLRYGLDNWYYGIVGYSAFSGEVNGERLNFRQGLFRFKLDRDPNDRHRLVARKLEFLRSTSNNSWGVGLSEEGLLFGSTANGCPTVFMPIANRHYEKVRGLSPDVLRNIAPDNHFEPITDKVRQVDWHGGFTAAAGHALYTAREYPSVYWNRVAFVCEPTGHLIAMFELTPYGADFRARYFGNLLASDDEWSSPIMAEVGPDGHVWVLDWYNFIIQHNPTPPGYRTGRGNAYESELRDKKHGRIYRVVHTSAKSHQPMTLKISETEKLIEALDHSNQLWRLTAQRLLVERAARDTITRLFGPLARAHSRAEDGVAAAAAVHAMWTADGLNAVENGADGELAGFIIDLLHHPSVAVRRTAVHMIARSNQASIPGELAEYASRPNVMNDAQVRLAVLLAMSERLSNWVTPHWDCAVFLAGALEDATFTSDPVLADALTIAAASHSPQFLAVTAVNGKMLSPRARSIVTTVARHYAAGENQMPSPLIVALSVAEPSTAETIITGLANGWRKGNKPKLTERADLEFAKLFEKSSPKLRADLLRLAAAWQHNKVLEKSAEVVRSILADALDDKKPEDSRLVALRQAMEIVILDGEIVERLLSTITPQSSPAFSAGVIEAVGASDFPAAAPAIIQRLRNWPPSARAAAMRALLGRTESTRVLLDALEKGQALIGDLALDQRQALTTHPDQRIAKRARAILAQSGGLPDPDRQKVLEQLLPLTKRKGDPAAGKAVFKNQCAKCHRHTGEGEQIGPDLTGMAVHTAEHLLVNIIDPSRDVEGNFRVYRVELKNGRSLIGMLASETRTTLELIDSEAKRHPLQRQDIDDLQVSNKSLMPEGFEKTLKESEIVDLLAFLIQRGKFLPLPLDKAATISSARGMFTSEEAAIERLIFPDWSPKSVEGVPFVVIDPLQGNRANVILLHSTSGKVPSRMPKSVTVPCNAPAKAIHLLSGVSGWGHPFLEKGSVSLVVRLHFVGGQSEDHSLINGVHFADYIRRVDVPGSKFAFNLNGRQMRYLVVMPKRKDVIEKIEFVKGPDATAPVIMAVTVEAE